MHEAEFHHAVFHTDVGDTLLGGRAVPGEGVGGGVVGEDVVAGDGVEVVLLVGTLAAVGLNQVVTGVHARVDAVVAPGVLVVVDMDNHKAGAGLVGIPTHFLAVLQREVLVVVDGADAVGHIVLRELLQTELIGGGVDVLELEPAQTGTLEGGVGAGGARLVVVAAGVHHIPGTELRDAALVDIVHVGQTQHMAELMAEGADALERRA